MNRLHLILFLAVPLVFSSCANEVIEENDQQSTESIASDMALDHFNIWVTHPQAAKKRLTDIGFIGIPDSLSKIHEGQGTTGRYFNFLNGYLELIFVYDQQELEENIVANPDLDFIERANFKQNGASPFGFALKVNGYDIDKIPFEKVQYHQDWMEDSSSIYAAKNSKTHVKEPSVFVVYPTIEADHFETLEDLKNIPEEYAMWREFFKHPNGAEKVTKIVITSPEVDLTTTTMRTLNGFDDVTIKGGSEHLMELYFDEHRQGKSFDLRPELPLKIHL